ncbi:unnamed protein product [Calypogeia fissa]
MVNGQKVAVKIAKQNTEEAKALLMEMTAYKMLKSYWGKYVPELVEYGTTEHPRKQERGQQRKPFMRYILLACYTATYMVEI